MKITPLEEGKYDHVNNRGNNGIDLFYEKDKKTGSLFEKPFKRIQITSYNYFQDLIYYIYNNLVEHGFVESMIEYPWSSYGTIISKKPTKLKRNRIIEIFDEVENFKFYHNRNQNLKNITDFMLA